MEVNKNIFFSNLTYSWNFLQNKEIHFLNPPIFSQRYISVPPAFQGVQKCNIGRIWVKLPYILQGLF